MMTHDRVSACAPGRVELLGNHTDYNEGVVLGAAINRFICVSGVKNDRFIRITSADFGEVEIRPAKLRPLQGRRWANYILGVADELRSLRVPIRGLRLISAAICPSALACRARRHLSWRPRFFSSRFFPPDLSRSKSRKHV